MSVPAGRLRFCKMTGAGNDFILINAADTDAVPEPGALTRRLCARRTAVGADGLIIVAPAEPGDAHISVRFWNPDGAEVATCGNGTRCAARFALHERLAPAEMVMITEAGEIAARVSGATVTLRYAVRPTLALDATIRAPEVVQRGHRVELGNPHFVIPMARLPEGAIEPTCRPLRYALELAPEGANVHLVEVLDGHRLRIRSYERGVEAETLACGSGSMSAALAMCAAGQVESPVVLETRSGDWLTVRFRRSADGGFEGLELEGPARFVYWGELEAL